MVAHMKCLEECRGRSAECSNVCNVLLLLYLQDDFDTFAVVSILRTKAEDECRY
jgi:hypothetical protein